MCSHIHTYIAIKFSYMHVTVYSSAKHLMVVKESVPQRHSGESIQVKQPTAPVDVPAQSSRMSRNFSKSSTHKPIPVSSDHSTPIESPPQKIKNKNLFIPKTLSKASSHSDHSEKMKLAAAGSACVFVCVCVCVHVHVRVCNNYINDMTVNYNCI